MLNTSRFVARTSQVCYKVSLLIDFSLLKEI